MQDGGDISLTESQFRTAHANEMDLWVRALTTEPGDPSSIPGIHMVLEEK